jgi:hypothetical protein
MTRSLSAGLAGMAVDKLGQSVKLSIADAASALVIFLMFNVTMTDERVCICVSLVLDIIGMNGRLMLSHFRALL